MKTARKLGTVHFFRRIQKAPSLAPLLTDAEWIDDVWIDAKALAAKEAGIDQGTLPEVCPWAMTDVLTEAWLSA